ncbi:RadC family protein (plasmid) [Pseudoduganella sp. UC29_106]|uniref:JAB domain-containing protein n=1 Tax=Pseudoduganella sp. UC29_106 TaxID=3374553 RepID=UPI0037571A1F
MKSYLTVKLAQLHHEVFSVVWVDAQNRIIAYEEMFRGTLSHTSVYPREVVLGALTNHAAGCLLVHNHPSGKPDPSEADKLITRQLKQALELIDVRVLDHIIVAGVSTFSFAEHGLI